MARTAPTLTPCRGVDLGEDRRSAAPRRLQSLLIRGGGAPDVHMSLADGGGHGPALAATEAGGSAPERTGESVTVIEAAGRGGVTPKIMI
jgi:hypothetical protein